MWFKSGMLFFFISSVVYSVLIHSAGFLFISQVQKNVIFVIFNHRWWPRYVSPLMPTLCIKCKILAWPGKHVLVSEEASFPKGHIWNLFSESVWSSQVVHYSFHESERSVPWGNSSSCWGKCPLMGGNGKSSWKRISVHHVTAPWVDLSSVTENTHRQEHMRIHFIYIKCSDS